MGSRACPSMGALRFSVIITPAAEADLTEIIAWYEARHADLSFDLRLSLAAALDHIARYAESCALVAPTVRRALLRRFPHAVYYRRQRATIEVSDVLHTHRHPGVWQERKR